jgi:hypothetical protein
MSLVVRRVEALSIYPQSILCASTATIKSTMVTLWLLFNILIRLIGVFPIKTSNALYVPDITALSKRFDALTNAWPMRMVFSRPA